jgi:hypothetical protein
MKYYVSELNINAINFKNLKNKLYYENETKNIILSDDGYYTIYNNQYYRHCVDTSHAINENCYYKINKYLDNYTLYVDSNNWIRKKATRLPPKHVNIIVNKEIYKLNEKCNVSFVVERNDKGDVCDLYFLSQLSETNYSFQETMSYLLSKLI